MDSPNGERDPAKGSRIAESHRHCVEPVTTARAVGAPRQSEACFRPSCIVRGVAGAVGTLKGNQKPMEEEGPGHPAATRIWGLVLRTERRPRGRARLGVMRFTARAAEVGVNGEEARTVSDVGAAVRGWCSSKGANAPGKATQHALCAGWSASAGHRAVQRPSALVSRSLRRLGGKGMPGVEPIARWVCARARGESVSGRVCW
jgi:hypothetical protein